jgi:hypothetical protein
MLFLLLFCRLTNGRATYRTVRCVCVCLLCLCLCLLLVGRLGGGERATNALPLPAADAHHVQSVRPSPALIFAYFKWRPSR